MTTSTQSGRFAPLRATFTYNPRLRPLFEGEIECAVPIDWDVSPSVGHVQEHLEQNPFDIFEFSAAGYITAVASGRAAELGWTALPIFLTRPFRMFERFVSSPESGIKTLGDLAGRRLGVREYRSTAAVWLRAILRLLYGIDASDIEWVNQLPMESSYPVKLGGEAPPTDVKVEQRSEPNLFTQVRLNMVDAAFGEPTPFGPDDSELVRFLSGGGTQSLFADMGVRLGVTPANHIAIVKASALEAYPTLATDLIDAVERSKQVAYERALNGAQAYLWNPQWEFDQQASLVGADPYPSGVKANQTMLDILIAQMRLDNQIPEAIDLGNDRLFA